MLPSEQWNANSDSTQSYGLGTNAGRMNIPPVTTVTKGPPTACRVQQNHTWLPAFPGAECITAPPVLPPHPCSCPATPTCTQNGSVKSDVNAREGGWLKSTGIFRASAPCCSKRPPCPPPSLHAAPSLPSPQQRGFKATYKYFSIKAILKHQHKSNENVKTILPDWFLLQKYAPVLTIFCFR